MGPFRPPLQADHAKVLGSSGYLYRWHAFFDLDKAHFPQTRPLPTLEVRTHPHFPPMLNIASGPYRMGRIDTREIESCIGASSDKLVAENVAGATVCRFHRRCLTRPPPCDQDLRRATLLRGAMPGRAEDPRQENGFPV